MSTNNEHTKSKSKYKRQVHYLTIATRGHSIRGLAENVGVAPTRIVRLLDGTAPILAWELSMLAKFTGVSLLVSTIVMDELREEALDVKFPDRAMTVKRELPFDPWAKR